MELYVDLGAHSYSIYIENNILKDTGSYIEKVYSGKKIMIISDDNVFPLYGDTIVKTLEDEYEVHSLILPHGEPTKSFQSLPKIYSALLEARFSRSDLIIALGGGVIGDLAGFAAASFLRGIKFIQIPTSLLAHDFLLILTRRLTSKILKNVTIGIGAFIQSSNAYARVVSLGFISLIVRILNF